MFHLAHEFFEFLEHHVNELNERIDQLEGSIMAEIDDLKAVVLALVNEDSVVLAEIDKLKAAVDAAVAAGANSIPVADVVAATSTITAEVARMQDKVAAVDPPAPTPAPAPAPAPAPDPVPPVNPVP